MHVYQMRSSVASVVTATQERLTICMNALKEVSKVWLVAKMVHTLFESILGNKMLEDKLQKAAGKKHKKPRIENRPADKDDQQQQNQQSHKRKLDDMEFGYSSGPPAPQVSYERSRPQTPAVTPSRDLGQPLSVSMNPMAAPPPTSDHMRQQNDAFMGSSRNNTRPPTPFNPAYPNIATPPDLYLVTRESPSIPQNLWENFQPDQLFPESTNIAMPYTNQQNLDPQLQMPQMQSPGMLQPPTMQGQQQIPSPSLANISPMSQMAGMQQQTPSWHGQVPGDSPEDNWSNSSRGPIAPPNLNVEDW